MNSVVYTSRIFAMQQRGGISRYFCELATRVHRAPDFDCRIVAPLHFNDHLLECEAPQHAQYLRLRARTGRLYRGVNRLLAPGVTAAARPDLVHHTYYAPDDYSVSKRNVVTVYDMIHELYAEQFPLSDKTSSNKRLCVDRAEHVICISQSTAADLIRLFGVPERKLSVTHLGYSSVFDSRPDYQADTSRPSFRPYLLYVGQRRGYKGFDEALKAYASSARLRNDFDLVVFGGSALTADERALIHSLAIRDDAIQHWYGNDIALAAAYRQARAFVYPSRYEGFGIPPLEAMASGCPVVCAAVSSLPEVVGAAAECFDPDSGLDSLRAAIESACFDDTRRSALVRLGLERVKTFSWDQCAHDTVATYRQMLRQ